MSDTSVEGFEQKSECFIKQYNSYTKYGIRMNGEKTLSENIADNAGVHRAYDAYQTWVRRRNGGRREKKLVGLDLDANQLFYLAFGQLWCSVETRDDVRWTVDADKHMVHDFRVIGSLQNSPAFSETFRCPLGSPMNPRHKCKLW